MFTPSWLGTASQVPPTVSWPPPHPGVNPVAHQHCLRIPPCPDADLYGSPSLDDVEVFTRQLTSELEAALGAEAAGEIELEVSSPVGCGDGLEVSSLVGCRDGLPWVDGLHARWLPGCWMLDGSCAHPHAFSSPATLSNCLMPLSRLC